MEVYLILGGYLLLNLVGVLWGLRFASDTPDQYFLANRTVGTVVLFFTFVATNFSAFFFLGFAGEGYRIGYSYYAMMAFGTAFAAISFYLIGYRVWQEGRAKGYITPAEMMGDMVGSPTLRYIYLGVMLFFTLPYLALQPIGAGYLLETMTGGQIPYFSGAVLLTAFIVLYTFIGGMRTVAITDVIQGVLMFVLMFAALYAVGEKLGGLRAANDAVYQMKPELFSRTGGGGYFGPAKWFSLMLLWTLCVPMFPHMFMRFFISRSLRAFKISTLLYAVIPLLLFLCPVMIGVFGHLVFPDLAGRAADRILPMMLMELMPASFAALIMVGALAAFMSTLDSQLLALSTLLTRDLVRGAFGVKMSMSREVQVGRVMIVGLALAGLLIALNPPGSIFNIVRFAFSGFAVLFPATLAILRGPRLPAWAYASSILVGEALLLTFFLGWLATDQFWGLEPVVPACALATVMLGIGWILRPSSGVKTGT